MRKEGYTAEPQKGRGVETVYQKAIRLHREGRVHHVSGLVYEVRGEHGTYRVDLYRDGCDCPARSGGCSHELAAEIAQAKLNAATARKLAEARARKPRVRYSADQVMANLERMGA
jgi:hypothetical protein